MSGDPYAVLGLKPGASDDEVKAAYKRLAKKYHPDINKDPGAEAKMKEINEAYDRIINKRPDPQPGYGAGGYSGGYGGARGQGGYYGPFGFDPFGFGGQRGSYQGGAGTGSSGASDSPELRAVRDHINARRYDQALNALARIPTRNARWYYYSALANAGVGNSITALEHARQAAAMDPGNYEYQQLLQQLQYGSTTYRTRTRSYSSPMVGINSLCTTLCVANLLCRFCGC